MQTNCDSQQQQASNYARRWRDRQDNGKDSWD